MLSGAGARKSRKHSGDLNETSESREARKSGSALFSSRFALRSKRLRAVTARRHRTSRNRQEYCGPRIGECIELAGLFFRPDRHDACRRAVEQAEPLKQARRSLFPTAAYPNLPGALRA